jgi:hypothetical protein
MDCAGEWGGSAVKDDCGICNGDNSSCSDCANVPDGDSLEDNCGNCDNDSSNDCVQDCADEWGGSAYIETFYLDFDNDGLGAGDGVELCNGLDHSNYVTNNDDSDDDCVSNVHDCHHYWSHS